MNAQEWLDDLEAKAKAATPGPWEQRVVPDEIVKGLYHDAVYQDDTFVAQTCWYKADRYECVKDKADANAVYISAACNAVPRLVEMLRIAVCMIEAQNAQRARKGERILVSDVMQLLFTMTEPKE